MEYRLLRTADAERVYALGKKDFGSRSEYSWDWSVAKVRQYAKRAFGFGYVCLERSRIVGFALVENHYASQRPNVAWFTYVFVGPAHRKSGIGAELVRLTVSRLRRLGKTGVMTDVFQANSASLRFFKENGFRLSERWVMMDRRI